MAVSSMSLVISEASAFDMLEALDDLGRPARIGRRRFALVARQVSQGATLTIRTSGGELCLCGGLWPEPDHAEAWFAVGPACQAHLGAVLRIVARVTALTCRAAGVAEVRTYVHPDSVAGARIARLLGFEVQPGGQPGAPTVFIRRFHEHG